MISIVANGVTLPSPVEITTTDEIIWSANTGRAASGKMIGDVVAQKKTFDIKWGVLPQADFNKIRSNLKPGFYPFKITVDGGSTTITSYRSNVVSSILGTFGGITYRKDTSVTIIQQ